MGVGAREEDVRSLGAHETQLDKGSYDYILWADLTPRTHTTVFVPGTGVANKLDRKSTRLNSSHSGESRMPSSA